MAGFDARVFWSAKFTHIETPRGLVSAEKLGFSSLTVSGETRYDRKRSAVGDDESSFLVVAGAPFAPDEKTRPSRLEHATGFSLPLKPVFRDSCGPAVQPLADVAAPSPTNGARV